MSQKEETFLEMKFEIDRVPQKKPKGRLRGFAFLPDEIADDNVRPPSALQILLDCVRQQLGQLDREEVGRRRDATEPLRSEMFTIVPTVVTNNLPRLRAV